MKLKDMYTAAIEIGIKNDPRGATTVADYLKTTKKKYSDMSEKKKK